MTEIRRKEFPQHKGTIHCRQICVPVRRSNPGSPERLLHSGDAGGILRISPVGVRRYAIVSETNAIEFNKLRICNANQQGTVRSQKRLPELLQSRR